ncbi:MAG: hypothetical protein IJY39_06870 [Clostridia bacterium]|nr:hypothetical protein [Clostridia bacterium]
MEFVLYLREHIKKHPSVMPQDVVKFCYQAAFGAEHLLSDLSVAKRYFDAEFNATEPREGQPFECLSDEACRVDLGAWKSTGMPAEWLFNMFVASASVKKDAAAAFDGYLHQAEAAFDESIGFGLDEWRAFLENYLAQGVGAVHHSDIYRKSEKPAYRIVDRKFLPTIVLLEKLKCVTKESGAKIVAIDGRAASGKTTLAALLKTILGASVIRMDDFFLPPPLRTPERLSEMGGNVHYERFCEEVIPLVNKNDAFSYGVFDCGRMDLNGECLVEASEWRIVEGSYSHHPNFGDYADVKVFCTVSPEEQMKRILLRNGEKMAERFKKEWIPMEEKYFEAFHVCQRADVILKLKY